MSKDPNYLVQLCDLLSSLAPGCAFVLAAEGGHEDDFPPGVYYLAQGTVPRPIMRAGGRAVVAGAGCRIALFQSAADPSSFAEATASLIDCRDLSRTELPFAIAGTSPRWSEDGERLAFAGYFDATDTDVPHVAVYDTLTRQVTPFCDRAASHLNWIRNDTCLGVVTPAEDTVLIEEIRIADGRIIPVTTAPTQGGSWGHVIDKGLRTIAFQQRVDEFDDELRIIDIANGGAYGIDEIVDRHDVEPFLTPDGMHLVYAGFVGDERCIKIHSVHERRTVQFAAVNSGDDVGEIPVLQPFWLTEGQRLGVVSYEESGDTLVVMDLISRTNQRFSVGVRISQMAVVGTGRAGRLTEGDLGSDLNGT